MRLLVLPRHGESTLKVERVVNGDPARDVWLTERGRAQSRLLGAQVRNMPWTSASIPGSSARAKRPKSHWSSAGLRFAVESLLDDVDVDDLRGHRSRITSHGSGRTPATTRSRTARASTRLRAATAERSKRCSPGSSGRFSSSRTRSRFATRRTRQRRRPISTRPTPGSRTRSPYCLGEDQLAGAAEGLATAYRGRR